MALFFIEYDLRKRRDYPELYAELAKFKAVRILESQWCFNRNNTSTKALRDHFKQCIDSDDALMVSEVSDWSSFNVDDTPNSLS